ncbi:MAG: ROK family protein [bacterium]|nr:ROK family protein [bacterium]
MSYRIGIDLGGTKVETILLDSENEVLFRHRIPTPPLQTGQAPETRYLEIVAAVCSLVREAASQIPASTTALEKISRTDAEPPKPGAIPADVAVGIGIPGILDRRTGRVINANTTCLIGHPLQQDLEAELGRPIAIENDANCFTAAECVNGAARGKDFVFGVIMGTGCGGGLWANGRIRSGMHGIGGEWGHISIDPQGRQCWCGNRGCIETMISGSGVEAGHKERTGQALPMRDIVAGFRAGDADCQATMQAFFADFGRALGGIISAIDPDLIVLGGGLSNIPELYTQGVARVQDFAFHPGIQTPIVKNELGDSAGVFGAAAIGI